MSRIQIGAIGLLIANTIGAGIFGLPYVASVSGWGLTTLYLVILGALLIVIHSAYGEALDRVPGHHRLTGLIHLYLPRRVFAFGALSIIGGLILSLVVCIILASNFVRVVNPEFPYAASMIIFWLLGTLPLFVRLRRIVEMEFIGTLAMGAVIMFVLASAERIENALAAPAISGDALFFPFGIVLFSLAAWTAIGPMREYERNIGMANEPKASSVFWGTTITVVLYAAFILGILGSSDVVSEDTLTGLTDWSRVKVSLLAFFGLIALWTTYLPIAAEARDALERDFNWRENTSIMLVALLPLLVIAMGLDSFIAAIALAGGAFLSVQYIFIVLVTKQAVRLPAWKRRVLTFALAIFVLATVYEIYHFVLG